MKKLKNLKQSIMGKNIFKRLRNTINSGIAGPVSISGSVGTNYTQLNGKKLVDLIESSSSYVINSSIGASKSSTTSSVLMANFTSNSASTGSVCPGETISTSSLISKCQTKREAETGSGKKSDYEKLVDFDSMDGRILENGDFNQIYFSHYIGNTILSYDTSLEGSASKFISKIIETSKQMKRKQRRVLIKISLKGFRIIDCDTLECLVDASIYRISYVTLSKTQKNVYAFIYQNSNSRLIECHAFDCKSKNYAKNLLSASFFAFNLAYEKYYKEKDSVQREIMLKESNAYEIAEKKIQSQKCQKSAEMINSVDFSKQLEKLDELIYDASIEASVIGSKKLNNSLPLINI